MKRCLLKIIIAASCIFSFTNGRAQENTEQIEKKYQILIQSLKTDLPPQQKNTSKTLKKFSLNKIKSIPQFGNRIRGWISCMSKTDIS